MGYLRQAAALHRAVLKTPTVSRALSRLPAAPRAGAGGAPTLSLSSRRARTDPGPPPHARSPGRGAGGELLPSSLLQDVNGGDRAAAAPRASGAPQLPPLRPGACRAPQPLPRGGGQGERRPTKAARTHQLSNRQRLPASPTAAF